MIENIKNSKFFRWLLKFQRFILVITTALVVLLVVMEALARYVLKKDFTGSEELVTIAAMWLYYIGGSLASYRKIHIKADILGPLIKDERKKALHQTIIHAISAFVLVVFSVWLTEYVKRNIQRNVVSVALKIPLWTSQVALLVGFILMLFFTLIHMGEEITRFIALGKGKEETP